MLTSEQRKQVFAAAYNAFIQDLERKTGYTIVADVNFSKKARMFGTYDLLIVVVPIEGWEPEPEEPNADAEKK